jgi:hypothetical protein
MTIQELHYDLAKVYMTRHPGMKPETCIDLALQDAHVWLRKFPGMVDLKAQAVEASKTTVTKTAVKSKAQELTP